MVKYFNMKLSVWHRPPRGKDSYEGAQFSSSEVRNANADTAALLTQTLEALFVSWCSRAEAVPGDKVQAEFPWLVLNYFKYFSFSAVSISVQRWPEEGKKWSLHPFLAASWWVRHISKSWSLACLGFLAFPMEDSGSVSCLRSSHWQPEPWESCWLLSGLRSFHSSKEDSPGTQSRSACMKNRLFWTWFTFLSDWHVMLVSMLC